MDQEFGPIRKNIYILLSTIMFVGMGFVFVMYSPYGDRPFAEAVSCTFNSDCIPAEHCEGGQCVFNKVGAPQSDREIPAEVVLPPGGLHGAPMGQDHIQWTFIDNSDNEVAFEIGYFDEFNEFIVLQTFDSSPGTGFEHQWDEEGLECGTTYPRVAAAVGADGGRSFSDEASPTTLECDNPDPSEGPIVSCEGIEGCWYIDLDTLEFLAFNAGGNDMILNGNQVINPNSGKVTIVTALSCSGNIGGTGSCSWEAYSSQDGTWYTSPTYYLVGCEFEASCEFDFEGYANSGQYYYGTGRFSTDTSCDELSRCAVIF